MKSGYVDLDTARLTNCLSDHMHRNGSRVGKCLGSKIKDLQAKADMLEIGVNGLPKSPSSELISTIRVCGLLHISVCILHFS